MRLGHPVVVFFAAAVQAFGHESVVVSRRRRELGRRPLSVVALCHGGGGGTTTTKKKGPLVVAAAHVDLHHQEEQQTHFLVDAVLRTIQWYDQRLRHSPFATKIVSNGLASALGDTLAQTLTSPTLDRRRVLAWALTGWFYFGPVLHVWYDGLSQWEKHLVESRGTSKFNAVLAQIAFNQFIGASVVNSIFLYWMAVTKMLLNVAFDGAPLAFGTAFAFATTQMSTTFPRMMWLNWLYWPIPTLLNLHLVPLRWRVLFSNTFSIIWKCIISIVTSSSMTTTTPSTAAGGPSAAAAA